MPLLYPFNRGSLTSLLAHNKLNKNIFNNFLWCQVLEIKLSRYFILGIRSVLSRGKSVNICTCIHILTESHGTFISLILWVSVSMTNFQISCKSDYFDCKGTELDLTSLTEQKFVANNACLQILWKSGRTGLGKTVNQGSSAPKALFYGIIKMWYSPNDP